MSTSAAIAASRPVADGLRKLGYGSDRLFENYEFSDVGSSSAQTRVVTLAAFTHSPPSYRSAAFAVIEGDGGAPGEATDRGWLTSLGAPVVFVVSGVAVDVLRVGASRTATKIATVRPDDIAEFIEKQRAEWSPEAMRRLKLFGSAPGHPDRQLDFFDQGLLQSVEAYTRGHLSALLGRVLDTLRGSAAMLDQSGLSVMFRLLAAKVLIDRRHPAAEAWGDDADGVLAGIAHYYGGDRDDAVGLFPPGEKSVASAWDQIRNSMTLRNVSSDDLAFVYENSFVTDRARTDLGTHSTPREVVEYACDRLPFETLDPGETRVFEPFAGAGVFLIAAMRRLGDLVGHMPTEERHAFLVERITGSEFDKFACQVAQLALILADYPNRNGWQVRQSDLFESGAWLDHIGEHSIVFCNPPYESFSKADRNKYRPVIGGATSKPQWISAQLIARKPAGLALVLPRAFALEKRWEDIRAYLEETFGEIEILALPENTFAQAGFETCLVVAKSPRGKSEVAEGSKTRITSTFVSHSDLASFKASGAVSWTRSIERPRDPLTTGQLWADDRAPLWEELRSKCKPLSSRWEAHRGVEWITGYQKVAWVQEKKPGFRAGYHPNDRLSAFVAPVPGWLDVRPGFLRGGAHGLPWEKPKVILNAARRSRGTWKVTAFAETGDFAASQQFIGLWPLVEGLSLIALAAVLNGPVANAFLTDISFGKAFRIDHLNQVPLPGKLDSLAVEKLVRAYLELLHRPGSPPEDRGDELRLAYLRIDACVLAGYELSARMERDLLLSFAGEKRPVPFPFKEFYRAGLPAFPLGKMIDGSTERATWANLKRDMGLIDKSESASAWEFID